MISKYGYHYLELESLSTSIQLLSSQIKGGWLLDVGCGDRPYAHFFPSIDRYVGIDLHAIYRPVPGVDVWADALSLPFVAQQFDVVLCTQVLEHVAMPLALIQEIFRVLRPAGKLILTAPQTWGLHEEPWDYYRFTRYGLEWLLIQSGFENIQIIPRSGVFRLIGQVFLSAWYVNRKIESVGFYLRRFNYLVNTVFEYLDRKWFWPKDTLGYAVLANRPLRD